MFEDTRRNIGIFLTRFLFLKKESKPMSFSNVFSHAKSALVILPENPDHRSAALPMLTVLQNKFKGTKLTFVVHEAFRNLTRTFVHSTIITIRDEQLNFFFLPKKSGIEKILNERFDVVIDLNFTHVPTATYLCRQINAPLKVGFSKAHADSFYNFQFNASPNKHIAVRYQQLFRTLSMF